MVGAAVVAHPLWPLLVNAPSLSPSSTCNACDHSPQCPSRALAMVDTSGSGKAGKHKAEWEHCIRWPRQTMQGAVVVASLCSSNRLTPSVREFKSRQLPGFFCSSECHQSAQWRNECSETGAADGNRPHITSGRPGFTTKLQPPVGRLSYPRAKRFRSIAKRLSAQ